MEILLVVGIIAILAGIVIVALNPTKQFAAVRNTQRKMNLGEINKAIQQYYIDYSRYPATMPTTLTEICNTGMGTTTHSVNCTGLVDLSVLVPTYLVAIPVDPQGSTLSLIPKAFATTNGTGYKIMLESNRKIVLVGAQAELGAVIAIGTTTMPVISTSLIPTDGLISYWPFTGTTTDIIGARNGVKYGDTALTTGVKVVASTAYTFDGAGDYIRVPVPTPLNKTSTFSISVWVKFNAFVTSGAIIGQRDYPSGYNQFDWSLIQQTAAVSFYTCKETVAPCYGIDSPIANFSTGTYYHLVGVYDNTNMKFYVNGTYIGTNTFAHTNVATSTVDMIIGGQLDWGNPQGYTKVVVDEVRLYNRVLTQTEITNIYNEEKP